MAAQHKKYESLLNFVESGFTVYNVLLLAVHGQRDLVYHVFCEMLQFTADKT